MNEPHLYDINQIYLQSDSALYFRLTKMKYIEDFSIAEINGIEKMNKKKKVSNNKYITLFDFAKNLLLVFPRVGCGVSLFSFTNVIGTPVGLLVSSSFSLLFVSLMELPKCF